MNAYELENSNKPVAWMQMHHKDNVPTKFSPVKVWEDDIPLYTIPQTKPLSDEEIEIECRKAWNLHDQDQLNLAEVIKFARAIEAKVRGQ